MAGPTFSNRKPSDGPEIGGGSAFLVAVQAAIFLGHSLLSSIQCAQKFSRNLGKRVWMKQTFREVKQAQLFGNQGNTKRRKERKFRFGLIFEYFTRPCAYLGAHGIRVFSIFCQG
jgi:hypothetical protein